VRRQSNGLLILSLLGRTSPRAAGCSAGDTPLTVSPNLETETNVVEDRDWNAEPLESLGLSVRALRRAATRPDERRATVPCPRTNCSQPELGRDDAVGDPGSARRAACGARPRIPLTPTTLPGNRSMIPHSHLAGVNPQLGRAGSADGIVVEAPTIPSLSSGHESPVRLGGSGCPGAARPSRGAGRNGGVGSTGCSITALTSRSVRGSSANGSLMFIREGARPRETRSLTHLRILPNADVNRLMLPDPPLIMFAKATQANPEPQWILIDP
jgi:hypothetical protein